MGRVLNAGRKRWLLPVCVAGVVGAAPGLAEAVMVMYGASGMFNDGTVWTAKVTFPESAMADMMVTVGEYTGFDVNTLMGRLHPAATYDLSEIVADPDLAGFTFDGTTAGANVTGIKITGWGDAVDSITRSEFLTARLHTGELADSIHIREEFAAPTWSFIGSAPTGVPEPLSLGLTGLGLGALLITLRRRRSA